MGKKTTLSDLRDELFDVLQRLKDGNDPDCDKKDTIDIERAKAISDVSGNIIAAAKLEADALKFIAKNEDVDFVHLFSKSGIAQLPENNNH